MFGLGMGELIVIFAVALLVFGPKRLPDLASGLGKAIRDFRRATRDLQDQLEVDDAVRRPMQELRAALRDEPPPPPLAGVPAQPLAGTGMAPPATVAQEHLPGAPAPAAVSVGAAEHAASVAHKDPAA